MNRQETAVSRSRKRDACDRCHEMKSRCHKLAGSTSCIRCERSGGQCHFSEALRAGRPKKRTTTTSLKQEPSPPSTEASQSNEADSPLDIRLETSSAIVENGMDMLNFNSPLPDFFVSPQSLDEQMDTTTSDSTFENWLSINPNDTQIVCAEDQNTSPFSDSVQLGSITPEQFRMGSTGSSISSTSSGIQNSGRPESDVGSSASQEGIVQQLLYLHSTLQRILTVQKNGGVLNWENTWTPQTAAEETFLATDRLVAVMEGLSQQSIPSSPASDSAITRNAASGEKESPKTAQSGADSTSLLVLSCYICALEVYQAQVDTMKDQVNDMINESCNAAGNGGSDSSTRASPLNSSANIMPVLNIGQFNLGMSPKRNLSLLLHLTQDMVEQLQGAVQHWSATGESKDISELPQHDNEGASDFAQKSELSRSRKDSVLHHSHEHKSRHAMSSVFDSVLAGVHSREKMLGATMQEVKNMLKSK